MIFNNIKLHSALLFIIFFFISELSFSQENIIRSENVSSRSLCSVLSSSLIIKGSSSVKLVGTWSNLTGCAVRLSSETLSVHIDASEAKFIASEDIETVVFMFVVRDYDSKKDFQSTDVTWIGGEFDTSLSNREQFEAKARRHNVGTALTFSGLNNVLINGVSVFGGVDTKVNRKKVNPGKDRYIGGDSGITGSMNTSIEIKNSYFKGLVDAGVYLGGGNSRGTEDDGGTIYVHHNKFVSNNIGAVFKRQAFHVIVKDNIFIENNTGAMTATVDVLRGEAAQTVDIINNLFINHLSAAVRLKDVTKKATTYGNLIYGIGNIGLNSVQPYYSTGISYQNAAGLIRMNKIEGDRVPSYIKFGDEVIREKYINPRKIVKTTGVKVTLNKRGFDIHHNSIANVHTGIIFEGAKDINFLGNIKAAEQGVLLLARGNVKTTGSKIKTGLFSQNGIKFKLGFKEYSNNRGASFENKFCAPRDESVIKFKTFPGSNTLMKFRRGWSKVYLSYLGAKSLRNSNSCGF